MTLDPVTLTVIQNGLRQVASEMERQLRTVGYKGWHVVLRPRTCLDQTFSQEMEQFGLIFEEENAIQDMEQFGLIPEEAGDIGRTGAEAARNAARSPASSGRIPGS